MRDTGELSAFVYVTVEKAPLYRAIMQAFVDAKERFVLHLRPGELRDALKAGVFQTPLGDGELEAALSQLRDWGNVEAHPDTAEVATVEEFYRPRSLYQLTRQGEAAERALRYYEQALHQRGELQAAALGDIVAHLRELQGLAVEPDPDEAKVHRAFRALRERFDELTERAQAFMGSLQRTVVLHGLAEKDLFAYKRTLVEYLERFVGELLISASTIGELIRELEHHTPGIERLLEIAGRRDMVDAFEPTEDQTRVAIKRWHLRWQGFRAWFIGSRERPSQANVLRSRARTAIPALLSAIAGMNDRRVLRSDRAADLRTLALWFSELDSDADAHRLWRAAFGLNSSRHLRIDEATLRGLEAVPVGPSRSWLDAPPIRIAPRLRATGRHTRRGRVNNVIDFSRDKEILRAAVALEAVQIEKARKRLATDHPTRLSAIGALDPAEFYLLLDLLGEALGSQEDASGNIETISADGTLRITLTATRDGCEAVILTSFGALRGPDYVVWIRDAFAVDDVAPVPASATRELSQ